MSKRQIITFIVTMLIVIFLCFYKLEAYIMKPGSAYDVSEFVSIENGDTDDEGSLSLMTVAMANATPLTYAIAYFREFEEIMDIEEVRHDEENEEEYTIRQLTLMSESQFNAIYVAFQRAELPFEIQYNGIIVQNVLIDGAADGILKPGDKIVEVDGKVIHNSGDLSSILDNKDKNDTIEIVIDRQDQLLDETIELKEIPNMKEKRIGLGITFAENKHIRTEPRVKVNAEDIGGPSAGLMFTLEILNQLLDEDLTKGYAIAGTGEMNEDGTVGRIGGVEKKIVAADKDQMDIFFAPDDEITDYMKKRKPSVMSNYEAAVKTAEKIGSNMEIVPVKTIDDALEYLEQLPEK